MGFEFLKLVCELVFVFFLRNSDMRRKERGSSPRRGSVLPAFFCYCSLAEINPTLFEKMRDLHALGPTQLFIKVDA